MPCFHTDPALSHLTDTAHISGQKHTQAHERARHNSMKQLFTPWKRGAKQKNEKYEQQLTRPIGRIRRFKNNLFQLKLEEN